MQNPKLPENPAELEGQGRLRLVHPLLPWTVRRLALVAVVACVYLIAFIPLYAQMGGVASALAMIPASLAGWLLGMVPGAIAGVMIGPVATTIMFMLAGQTAGAAVANLNIGSLIIIIVSGGVGWTSQLVAESRVNALRAEQMRQELLRQQQYASALHTTTLGLVGRLEIKELLQAIIVRAGELVGTSHGYVSWREPGQSEYELRVGIGIYSSFVGHRSTLDVGLTGAVVRAGAPVVVDDYPSWSQRVRDPSRDVLRAALGLPLKSGNEIAGVIGLAYTEKGRAFGQTEIDLLNRFAQLAAVALDNAYSYTQAQKEIADRKRAEEELRGAERFLDSVIESLPITLFAKDAQSLAFVRWNKAEEELFGVAREDALGKTDYDLSTQEQADVFTAQDREVLNGKILMDIPEEKVQTRNRGVRYLHTRKMPILDDQGEPRYLLGISEDVTERHRAQEDVRRLNEYLTALHDTSVSMIQHHGTQELLADIILRAGRLIGTEHGYVYLQDPATGEVSLRVGVGIYQAMTGNALRPGIGLAGKVWVTGQPVVIDDYRDWPGRLNAPNRDPLRAIVGVPLKAGDKVIGVIGLAYTDEENKFGAAEVQVLSRFADLAAIALDNARLFEQTGETLEAIRRSAEREAQMSAIGDRLHASNDPNSILQTALEELRRMTGRARTFVLLTGEGTRPERKEGNGQEMEL
ncbi:MAG: GAF domain-containing protein [Anaerolineae bacterium]